MSLRPKLKMLTVRVDSNVLAHFRGYARETAKTMRSLVEQAMENLLWTTRGQTSGRAFWGKLKPGRRSA